MQSTNQHPKERLENLRSHLHEHIHALTGQDQVTGLEIALLIHMLANQYEALEDNPGSQGLSGPRWGLLLRLAVEEKRGNPDTTPTYLSRCQNVSKNTISSLLRGLEEQALITRQLDPEDHRIFHIHLTPAGRSLIQATTPQRIRWLDRLAGGLSSEEQTALVNLLAGLYYSIMAETQAMEVK